MRLRQQSLSNGGVEYEIGVVVGVVGVAGGGENLMLKNLWRLSRHTELISARDNGSTQFSHN